MLPVSSTTTARVSQVELRGFQLLDALHSETRDDIQRRAVANGVEFGALRVDATSDWVRPRPLVIMRPPPLDFGREFPLERLLSELPRKNVGVARAIAWRFQRQSLVRYYLVRLRRRCGAITDSHMRALSHGADIAMNDILSRDAMMRIILIRLRLAALLHFFCFPQGPRMVRYWGEQLHSLMHNIPCPLHSSR